MRQIPLPLAAGARPSRIVVGNANAEVLDGFSRAERWPFHTAVLFGPPRSGKSLLASWFVDSGLGEMIDDGERIDETALFHRWNRAQESGIPLLIVANFEVGGWIIRLPDLASRIGGSLNMSIGAPDDAMLADLIAVHAEQRGFTLREDAAAYLVPRTERSHLGAEQLVAAIDRLSLERRQSPTLAVWREALEELTGGSQPRLI